MPLITPFIINRQNMKWFFMCPCIVVGKGGGNSVAFLSFSRLALVLLWRSRSYWPHCSALLSICFVLGWLLLPVFSCCCTEGSGSFFCLRLLAIAPEAFFSLQLLSGSLHSTVYLKYCPSVFFHFICFLEDWRRRSGKHMLIRVQCGKVYSTSYSFSVIEASCTA